MVDITYGAYVDVKDSDENKTIDIMRPWKTLSITFFFYFFRVSNSDNAEHIPSVQFFLTTSRWMDG